MTVEACATCADTYSASSNPLSEKPLLPGRHLECCGRSICSRCLNQNKRYETYCPYCQVTTEPSLLPQGLKEPPAYSTLDERIPSQASKSSSVEDDEELPAYSTHQPVQRPEKLEVAETAPDVLHFVSSTDSMHSLALAYAVPINALRKCNNVFSDHLIQARKTVLIPGEYYKGGVSLSPQPIEGEEEEARRNKVRRWMVACKVAEYDVALMYLQNAEWDLELATEVFRDDERWEKEHPLEAKKKGKSGKKANGVGMRRFVGTAG